MKRGGHGEPRFTGWLIALLFLLSWGLGACAPLWDAMPWAVTQ